MSEFSKTVYELVKQIPAGKVATYGQLAFLAGRPRAARIVGGILNKAPEGLPCHRVVNREGRTAPVFSQTGIDFQRLLLEEEGVSFLPDGRVDLKRFLWQKNA